MTCKRRFTINFIVVESGLLISSDEILGVFQFRKNTLGIAICILTKLYCISTIYYVLTRQHLYHSISVIDLFIAIITMIITIASSFYRLLTLPFLYPSPPATNPARARQPRSRSHQHSH